MNRPPCPVCTTPSTQKLKEEKGFTIFLCHKCDTIFVHPMPLTTELESYYNDLGHKLGEAQYESFSKKAHKAAIEYIRTNLKHGKALDVGCGYGGFLSRLTALGWDATGLDINPPSSKSGHQRIVQGQIENAPFENNSFSLITLWWVLEHSTDPLKAMSEVKRMLKKGGVVLIRVPNVPFIRWANRFRFLEKLHPSRLKNPISEKESVFDLLGPPHHLFGFSKESLEKIRINFGFSGMKILFLGQVQTGNLFRDSLDQLVYITARLLFPVTGKVLYHDLVVMLED